MKVRYKWVIKSMLTKFKGTGMYIHQKYKLNSDFTLGWTGSKSRAKTFSSYAKAYAFLQKLKLEGVNGRVQKLEVVSRSKEAV